jgi:FKBP-type peptidyl-prolyl cis-trans isomerase
VKSLSKFLVCVLAVGFLAAPALRAQREKLPAEDVEVVEKEFPKAKKTPTGLRYVVLQEGQGPVAKPGAKVAVVYVGRLLNGKVFNQMDDKANPFVFRIRRGEVIEGWDQILQLMKAGEKRLVIIPPEMAYGTRGRPPDIPRSATLVFEIELLEIKPD